MRRCEREGGTPGKTPYDFPSGTPYAGYIESSVRLFSALWQSGKFHLHGFSKDSDHEATLFEVYPGKAWPIMAAQHGLDSRDLKKKTLREGRQQRLQLLRQSQIQIRGSSLPNHDQLDAAIAALIAKRFADGRFTQDGVGPSWDESKQVLREGFIVYP